MENTPCFVFDQTREGSIRNKRLNDLISSEWAYFWLFKIAYLYKNRIEKIIHKKIENTYELNTADLNIDIHSIN